jgi:hypothetical protein
MLCTLYLQAGFFSIGEKQALVDVSQLFTYINPESNEESQADIQDIMDLLTQKEPQQIAMAKNVLREIFNNK